MYITSQLFNLIGLAIFLIAVGHRVLFRVLVGSFDRVPLGGSMGAGDVLDLHTALAPCVIGYGEIARALFDDPATRLEGNPYCAWIDAYAGEDYQALANAARQQLDALARRRLSEARVPALISTFRRATRLEAQFWQMGLDQSA